MKEAPLVTLMDVISALDSDFKDIKGDDKTVSQKDFVFLSKLKEGIKRNEMALPCKKRPHLPDNKRLAEIRLSHLQHRFNRNENYKKDYAT